MTRQAAISFSCTYAVWDGGNEDELRSVAGDQFVRLDGDVAVVRGASSREEAMTPGWVTYRAAGSARAAVCSPEAWAAMTGAQAA